MSPKNVQIVPFLRPHPVDRDDTGNGFHKPHRRSVLVTVVLYILLGNLRSAAIVAVIIPLSLLATFIGLKILGIPANLLSLGAIDFGIIVDGAVIVV